MMERSRGSRCSRGSAVALTAAAVVLLLEGCSGDADAPGSAEPSSAPASSSHVDHVHAGEETTAPAQEQDPAWIAERFLSTWSRPDVAYGEWWSDLEPLFNAQGQQAYARTDPTLVPRLRIEGELEVVPSTVSTSTTVWIPTDKGRFGLQLSRPTEHAGWLVSRVFFPETAEGSAALP